MTHDDATTGQTVVDRGGTMVTPRALNLLNVANHDEYRVIQSPIGADVPRRGSNLMARFAPGFAVRKYGRLGRLDGGMAKAEAQSGSIRSAAGSRVRPARRQEQRIASVKSMLDSARRQFIAKGYAATSVEEIAAGAGLSKGSVYFYFKSKENVLLALIEEAEQLIVEPAVAAVEKSGPSARDRLVAFLHAQSVAGQQYSEWMMLIILMSVELHGRGSQAEGHLASLSDKMKTLLTTIVTDGKQQGIFTRRAATRELASVIYAVSEGCFLEWYRYSDGLDGESLVRALRIAVLDGVLARPE